MQRLFISCDFMGFIYSIIYKSWQTSYYLLLAVCFKSNMLSKTPNVQVHLKRNKQDGSLINMLTHLGIMWLFFYYVRSTFLADLNQNFEEAIWVGFFFFPLMPVTKNRVTVNDDFMLTLQLRFPWTPLQLHITLWLLDVKAGIYKHLFLTVTMPLQDFWTKWQFSIFL